MSADVATAEEPFEDLLAEARRVTAAGDGAQVRLRVTGGVGIAIRCPSAATPPLARRYADLDLVARGKDHTRVEQLLGGLGYQPDRAFNTLHGSRRLFFWDPRHGRQLDVFLDRVEMCHDIDLRKRLDEPGPTLPLADLLLMKLQVVEANEKDLKDIVTLLVDHDFGDSGIDLPYLQELAADDWGLWRTTTMIAERADHYARELGEFAEARRVHARVATLLTALHEAPKSRRWKLRAKIGERKQWYRVPEESH